MTLQETAEQVQDHLEEIVRMFEPGVKITVLVRTPDHPTRDFMMTDDTIRELRSMLDRREPAHQR
jgi:hypothetical protein